MSLSGGTEEDLGGEDGLSIVTYESDIEKKPKKKKSNKPPKSPKSPYLSNTYLHPKKAAVWRSIKGTGTMHMENPSAKVPREMWVASLKQGAVVPSALSQSLKTEYISGYSRNSSYTSTPEYLKEALGMKKPKHSRSASNGYVPGTPDYKEKEDMYDEIIELKKMIQTQKAENYILKTKLRRSEKENSRKEKQIDQLLDPSKSSEYARSLIDKKNDTSEIVNGLKKKIYKLEKQCKEKDSILNKLQSDLKTTNIEEMKIATETYYEEIQRLRLLLTDNELADKKSIPDSRESQKQQKVLNSTILRLSKSLKHLQEENKALKGDLDKAFHSSFATSTAQGYSEWSKQRLVRRLLELEKKADDQERASSQSRTNSRGIEQKHMQAGFALDQVQQQEQQQVKQQQEYSHLRELVKKLKEDRSHLQKELAARNTEINQVIQEKTVMKKELHKLRKTQADKPPEEYRREIRSLTEKITQLEADLEEHRRVKLHCSDIDEKEDSDLDEAITMIQASARGHFARKKLESTYSNSQVSYRNNIQKQFPEEDERNEAVSVIQSSFRAHLARMQYLRENAEQKKSTCARNTEETTIRVNKSSNVQPWSKYSEYLKDNKHSDEDEEEAEPLKKYKISPTRLSLSRSRRNLPQTSVEVESDDSDVIVASTSRPLSHLDFNF
ncbi:IQ domain-containing protein E isoform X3 [Chiloscyllium plagiosum]|uniref:IQ domain-containing protein E isoform X3 n=1 Tax=Chiloscyllium plagiosum TaxID=36176 RepID=UPI001CB85319|nr:IQ domain-containing protein E isoform X3 [Chiloscyllium plagiosum]